MELRQRAYSRPNQPLHDQPLVVEDPKMLFTLPYCELILSLAEVLFPSNEVADVHGKKHVLFASDGRVERYVLLRAAWQEDFRATVQLALSDLTFACVSRYGGKHFAVCEDELRVELLQELQAGRLPELQWPVKRSQPDAFITIHDSISCGLLADPGYGGNADGLGWFYTGFMQLEG